METIVERREGLDKVKLAPRRPDVKVKFISREDARRLGDLVRARYRESFDLLKDK